MTRRCRWLLLHVAGGLLALPGCSLLSPGFCCRKNPPRVAENVSASNSNKPAVVPIIGTVESPEPSPPPRPVPQTKDSEDTRKGEKKDEPEQVGSSPNKVHLPGPTCPNRVDKPAPPLVEALRCMLEERHKEALDHLQAYDQKTQEFFLQMLPILALFTKNRLEQLAPEEVAVLTDQLQGLLATLRPRTVLVIERMCFCEKIEGYGDYQPRPPNYAFPAATPELVQIYVELRNFTSELRDGRYETRLSSSIEIRDDKGTLRKSFPISDQPLKRLLARLHDYPITYSFEVPFDLEPGTYELTLQIVDETLPEHRVARKSLEFRIGAAAVAASR